MAEENKTEVENKTKYYCSFCGASQDNVKKLVSADSVFICEVCIGMCFEIVFCESDTGKTGVMKDEIVSELDAASACLVLSHDEDIDELKLKISCAAEHVSVAKKLRMKDIV